LPIIRRAVATGSSKGRKSPTLHALAVRDAYAEVMHQQETAWVAEWLDTLPAELRAFAEGLLDGKPHVQIGRALDWKTTCTRAYRAAKTKAHRRVRTLQGLLKLHLTQQEL